MANRQTDSRVPQALQEALGGLSYNDPRIRTKTQVDASAALDAIRIALRETPAQPSSVLDRIRTRIDGWVAKPLKKSKTTNTIHYSDPTIRSLANLCADVSKQWLLSTHGKNLPRRRSQHTKAVFHTVLRAARQADSPLSWIPYSRRARDVHSRSRRPWQSAVGPKDTRCRYWRRLD